MDIGGVSLKKSHTLSPVFGLKNKFISFSPSVPYTFFGKSFDNLGLFSCHVNKFYPNLNEFPTLNVT